MILQVVARASTIRSYGEAPYLTVPYDRFQRRVWQLALVPVSNLY